MRISFLLVFFIFISCEEKETIYPFDQSPYVEFEKLNFTNNQNEPGVLSLSFTVWDEEGDLGSDDFDANPPYHYFNLVVDENDSPVTISGNFNPPFYSMPMSIEFNFNTEREEYYVFPEEKKFLSDTDTRQEYSCDTYLIFGLQMFDGDTLLGSRNRNRNSLQMNFLTDNGEKFDFQEEFDTDECLVGNYDDSIPELEQLNLFQSINKEVFEIVKTGKYSYLITYNIQSFLLKSLFLNNQLEIQFQVLDRELNKSNLGRSGLVTLEEITD